MLKFIVALTMLALTGCQATPVASTQPVDFMFPTDKHHAKEAIIATFLQAQYQIVRDSDFQLVLDRPAQDSFAAQLLFGSRFNGVPNARVMLTFLGDNPTTVNARMMVVTNPGSGFEQTTDITNNGDARASVGRGMSKALELASAARKS